MSEFHKNFNENADVEYEKYSAEMASKISKLPEQTLAEISKSFQEYKTAQEERNKQLAATKEERVRSESISLLQQAEQQRARDLTPFPTSRVVARTPEQLQEAARRFEPQAQRAVALRDRQERETSFNKFKRNIDERVEREWRSSSESKAMPDTSRSSSIIRQMREARAKSKERDDGRER